MTPTTDAHNERPYLFRKSNSTEKYDYRDVNLNGSVPEKIYKRIPLPEDYWKIHEEDVKVWRIGSTPPPTGKKIRESQKDTDWEYNVQKYENMTDRNRSRLQYYTAHDDNGNRKNSLEGDKKEIRFPGLKAFKSASMRLPGQKTSLQEVHQILRNKFNRLNVNLRKKRTMSVQEVFHMPGTQPGPPSPPHFYVPSPPGVSRSHYDDADVEEHGPSSLPFFLNGSQSGSSRQNLHTPKKLPCMSPIRAMVNGDFRKTVTRSQSVRTKHTSHDLDKERPIEKAPSSSRDEVRSPTQNVPGRISLREQNNMSRAAKITNVVKDKIRLRPRSHSPQKHYEPRTPVKTVDEKMRRNRDSFGGFFERFNRIMGTSHLPPPHHNNNSSSSSNNANVNQTSHAKNPQQRPKGTNVIANALSPTSAEPKEAKPTATANPTTSSTTSAPVAAVAAKKGMQLASTFLLNKRTDLNQTKNPIQLPEMISVRDRKITKQVRHYWAIYTL